MAIEDEGVNESHECALRLPCQVSSYASCSAPHHTAIYALTSHVPQTTHGETWLEQNTHTPDTNTNKMCFYMFPVSQLFLVFFAKNKTDGTKPTPTSRADPNPKGRPQPGETRAIGGAHQKREGEGQA